MGKDHCEKLGLALSGGGFRAAFFHLGVLAQLADKGLLRHVEVISTVSGGSIIGALYYLHLKELLESKPDHEITDADYRSIVSKIERDFLAGVEKNLRMRTFANPKKNWKMRRPDYSRSDRMGELYDAYFYRNVLSDVDSPRVLMRNLKIIPHGAGPDFHPRKDNATRSAKVPILLINATSLNTGRNWRFEASRMGEPPRLSKVAREIDKVPRLLRPPHYGALPDALRDLPLGTAVAASTAVPGLFHPLPISNLYPERRIELVDGGVHDNQGIQGLLDEGCHRFIISDASGQMEEDRNPSTAVAGVLARTNAVLMHRLREEQLFGVTEGARADAVGFIHMLQGLPTDVVPWQGAGVEPDEARRPGRRNVEVDPEVQRLLSRVRTDLDSFTEIEAYSLAYLGYVLSRRVVHETPSLAQLASRSKGSQWRFKSVRPWMERPTPEFLHHLDVAGSRLFKVFKLAPRLKAIGGLSLAALAGLALAASLDWLTAPRQLELQWAWWQVLLMGALVLAPLASRSLRMLNTLRGVRRPWAWVRRWTLNAILPTAVAVFIQIYLATFDRLFLELGRVDRLTPPAEAARPTQVRDRVA